MRFELEPLPYARDALEPHISAETLDYHHGRHHRKYVDTLNDLLPGSGYEGKSLDQIVAEAGSGAVFNNAAQVWNHDFYWRCLSPNGGGEPKGALAEALAINFGSADAFRKRFEQAAKDLFGVGWVWLVNTGSGVLSVEATRDADNPLKRGRIALLTCDVWEHAYYIDYRNDRSRYLQAFWHLVDWDFVQGRLECQP
jgi:Fe-Mn family superoxide dismutase